MKEHEQNVSTSSITIETASNTTEVKKEDNSSSQVDNTNTKMEESDRFFNIVKNDTIIYKGMQFKVAKIFGSTLVLQFDGFTLSTLKKNPELAKKLGIKMPKKK